MLKLFFSAIQIPIYTHFSALKLLLPIKSEEKPDDLHVDVSGLKSQAFNLWPFCPFAGGNELGGKVVTNERVSYVSGGIFSRPYKSKFSLKLRAHYDNKSENKEVAPCRSNPEHPRGHNPKTIVACLLFWVGLVIDIRYHYYGRGAWERNPSETVSGVHLMQVPTYVDIEPALKLMVSPGQEALLYVEQSA
ncbi:hypothetical protein VN97_g11587 [Penicillium thymicola]|uniref:Uncharacterized protein n=1 Tax=Penicillium thymicola TaxID=293382 RepID=A0AAI9X390_PENTH|nr:hypothetical protein VN97_g11587 [Penicillium thymicola]